MQIKDLLTSFILLWIKNLRTTSTQAQNISTAPLWNLYAAQQFYPCEFRRTSPESLDLDLIQCDHSANKVMGYTIPMIHPDKKVIREIRIVADDKTSEIPSGIFQHVGETLHRLSIQGARLRKIRKGAFLGLVALQSINIADKPRGKNSKRLTDRLFSPHGELKHLVELRSLSLINVNLSGTLPSNAFTKLSKKLKQVRLTNNEIRSIDDLAFGDSVTSITSLAVENQPSRHSDWIANAKMWAANMTSLKNISLNGNSFFSMPKSTAILKLDFGPVVNLNLEVLRLENCSLTSLANEAEISLENIGQNVKEIYLGQNKFSFEDGSLEGIRRFTRLRTLSFSGNRRQIYRLPSSLAEFPIVKLDLSYTQIDQLDSNQLPKHLRELSLVNASLAKLSSSWDGNITQLTHLWLDRLPLKTVAITGSTEGNWSAALRPLVNTIQVLGLSECELIAESLLADGGIVQVVGSNLGLKQMTRLRKLNLSRNYLTHIPPGILNASSLHLSHIQLQSNHIQTLDFFSDQITPVTNNRKRARLQLLDLHDNAITTLNRCAFVLGMYYPLETIIPLADGLKLTRNPLVCDCRIAWLRKHIGYHGNQHVNFTCVGSNKLAGRSFLSLTEQILYAESQPTCTRRPDIFGDQAVPCSQLQKPATATTEDANTENAFSEAQTRAYPFRPVRVFGYDEEDATLWLEVLPEALKNAWQNLAKMRGGDMTDMTEVLIISRLSNLPPNVIRILRQNYTVFQAVFWPLGHPENVTKNKKWHVTSSRGVYRFSARPVRANSAYTLCLTDALVKRQSVRSTLCQIFQPSEITGRVKLGDKEEREMTVWSKPIFISLVTVSILVALVTILIVCISKRYSRTKKNAQHDHTPGLVDVQYRESRHHLIQNKYSVKKDLIHNNSIDSEDYYERLADDNVGVPGSSRTKVPVHAETITAGMPHPAWYPVSILSNRSSNSQRSLSQDLPELPQRTPRQTNVPLRIRFTPFGQISASTGDLQTSIEQTPAPDTRNSRFIRKRKPTAGARSSLLQKIRKSTGDVAGNQGKKTNTTSISNKSNASITPTCPRVFDLPGDSYARSPKCTVSSPKLPPPFSTINLATSTRASGATPVEDGYLPIQTEDGKRSTKTPRDISVYSDMIDSYVLGVNSEVFETKLKEIGTALATGENKEEVGRRRQITVPICVPEADYINESDHSPNMRPRSQQHQRINVKNQ